MTAKGKDFSPKSIYDVFGATLKRWNSQRSQSDVNRQYKRILEESTKLEPVLLVRRVLGLYVGKGRERQTSPLTDLMHSPRPSTNLDLRWKKSLSSRVKRKWRKRVPLFSSSPPRPGKALRVQHPRKCQAVKMKRIFFSVHEEGRKNLVAISIWVSFSLPRDKLGEIFVCWIKRPVAPEAKRHFFGRPRFRMQILRQSRRGETNGWRPLSFPPRLPRPNRPRRRDSHVQDEASKVATIVFFKKR